MEITTSIQRGNVDVDSTFKIDKISMSFPSGFFDVVLGAEQISWNRGTLMNTSCTTYKRREGKNFLVFLQNILKTAFKMRIYPIDAHKLGNIFKN